MERVSLKSRDMTSVAWQDNGKTVTFSQLVDVN